jgi:hypothetical protein
MTYADITSVWFVRNGCLTPTEPGMPPTFECSKFSLRVDGARSTYSTRNVPGEVDIFASSIRLADLKAILSGSRFFDIDFRDYAPSGNDTTLIGVLRCSNVATMSLYDWRGLSDPRASTIADQILQLTKASTKTKIFVHHS